MTDYEFDPVFAKAISKLRDNETIDRVDKLVFKIIDSPEVGKPMRYERKGTREVYIGSYRLSYHYDAENDIVVFLDFYHKDEQ